MSVLDEIIAGVLEDLQDRKQAIPLRAQVKAAESARPVLPALSYLERDHLSVIAEVKRASPSKGHLAHIPAPADLAAKYEAGGAGAVSVLTEQRRFHGCLPDFDEVRSAVSIPMLRKDFMVDEYQFFEARAHGADLVLLIVAALDDKTLTRFYQLSADLGMTALVETHTADEVKRALDLGAQMIGVNNRNLKTLEVSLDTFEPLAELIDRQALVVAESGILETADAQRMADAGADVVLVGEGLVKHGDPEAAVAQMRAIPRRR